MLGNASPLTPGEADMAGKLNLAPGPLTRAYDYWARRLAEREGAPPMSSAAAPAPRASAASKKAAKTKVAKKKSKGRKR